MIGKATSQLRRHLPLLNQGEVAVGCVIMALWAGLASLWTGSWIGTVLLIGCSVALHLAAAETGNHLLAWGATAWVLVLIAITGTRTFHDVDPLVYTVAGTSALAHNELLRLGYARRRDAQIDRDIYPQAALAIGIVATIAFIGIALIEPLATGPERTWLWMPAAVAAIVGVGAITLIVPTIRAPKARHSHWRPGDRLPPRPRAEDSSSDGRPL